METTFQEGKGKKPAYRFHLPNVQLNVGWELGGYGLKGWITLRISCGQTAELLARQTSSTG